LTGAVSVPEKSAAVIEIKSSAGVYFPIGSLTPSTPILVLSMPGVFRVSRTATGASVGVDRY
jgi:VIT1/CCC1 family predicted Fe2+/Mn2+ transporter